MKTIIIFLIMLILAFPCRAEYIDTVVSIGLDKYISIEDLTIYVTRYCDFFSEPTGISVSFINYEKRWVELSMPDLGTCLAILTDDTYDIYDPDLEMPLAEYDPRR